MHARTPLVVHRDIKPDNISCFRLPDGSIQVKFVDFGLSKASDHLKTFCGSLHYAALEIYAKGSRNNHAKLYTSAVDIWSLGVVFAYRAVGFPHYFMEYASNTTAWNEVILEYFWEHSEKNIELISFLLDNMICIEPHIQKSAAYCQDQAFHLLDSLSRQQVIAESEGSDLHCSLIANSGRSGSPKTDDEGDVCNLSFYFAQDKNNNLDNLLAINSNLPLPSPQP